MPWRQPQRCRQLKGHDRSLRILVLSNLYPPDDLGGLEQLCSEAVQGLAARGHVVSVLTSRPRQALADEPGIMRRLYLDAPQDHYDRAAFFLRRGREQRANAASLDATLAQVRPDVVFIWGLWHLDRALVAGLVARRSVPVAAYVADLELVTPGTHEAYWRTPARSAWRRWASAPFRRLALRQLSREGRTAPLKLGRVACVSNFIRSRLLTAGVVASDSVVVHNGITLPSIAAPAPAAATTSGLDLLHVGGSLPHKGLGTLLSALAEARDAVAGPLRLTVVGGGTSDTEAAARRTVRALNLDADVSFLGRLPRTDLLSHLGGYGALVFPSECEEALPRAPMEAMAAGVPVIASATGGTPELVADGENGLLFPAGNVSALAAAIRRLADEPQLRRRLAQAGRRTVTEHFTLPRMIGEIDDYLTGIAGAATGTGDT